MQKALIPCSLEIEICIKESSTVFIEEFGERRITTLRFFQKLTEILLQIKFSSLLKFFSSSIIAPPKEAGNTSNTL